MPSSRFGNDFLKVWVSQDTLDQPVGHPDMPVPQSVLVSLPDCGIKNTKVMKSQPAAIQCRTGILTSSSSLLANRR
jgi:hypothetical protein